MTPALLAAFERYACAKRRSMALYGHACGLATPATNESAAAKALASPRGTATTEAWHALRALDEAIAREVVGE